MSDRVLTSDELDYFGQLVQFPITQYMFAYQSFVTNDIPNIVAYYSGNVNLLFQSSNQNLQDLLQQSQNLMEAIDLNSISLTNYKWFVLVDIIEQMDTLLQKMNSISKWLRSTIVNAQFNPNPNVQIPFKQGDTLESIERNTLAASDWDNAWIELALANNLREEDYTSEGGMLLDANYNYTAKLIKILSIVDNPVGVNILGIDIAAKLQLDPIAQDIVALSPQASFLQSCSILGSLAQGDVPEFPTLGITRSLVVGSNINNLGLPALFRQLIKTFSTDDTIAAFKVVSIDRKQDGLFLTYECSTRLQETQKLTLGI